MWTTIKDWVVERYERSAGIDTLMIIAFAIFFVIDVVTFQWFMAVLDLVVIAYVLWSVGQTND